jgi:hypothetical protein
MSGGKQNTDRILCFLCFVDLHLGIILANNKFDTQFFFLVCLLQFSTRFEQHRAHHQDNYLYQYSIWYTSLYVGDRLVWKSERRCQDSPHVSYIPVTTQNQSLFMNCSLCSDVARFRQVCLLTAWILIHHWFIVHSHLYRSWNGSFSRVSMLKAGWTRTAS